MLSTINNEASTNFYRSSCQSKVSLNHKCPPMYSFFFSNKRNIILVPFLSLSLNIHLALLMPWVLSFSMSLSSLSWSYVEGMTVCFFPPGYLVRRLPNWGIPSGAKSLNKRNAMHGDLRLISELNSRLLGNVFVERLTYC